MSRTSLQYQLHEKAGHFSSVRVPYPEPGDGEVVIDVKAIALNPVDWKRCISGFLVDQWPVVLGADAAGVVRAVGKGVQGFVPGDEVLALTGGKGNRAGGFQEAIVLSPVALAKKPKSLTFEEAASLPLGYLTAAAAIVQGLHVPLPFVNVKDAQKLHSILVLGGSSSVGAAAIQLLRIVLPEAAIFTTSSAKHHSRLLSLGANKVFERDIGDNSAQLLASTPGGHGVDAILDAVSAAVSQPRLFDAFDPNGPKLYAEVLTGQSAQVPQGVAATPIRSKELLSLPGGAGALNYLVSLIEDELYKVPIKVDVFGTGLEAIEPGLSKLRAGASGTKYVVSL